MADTNFVPGTVIASAWLNDINDAVYNATQDITGSVQRELTDKLTDVISFKDLGGVIGGVVDNAAALTAALQSSFKTIIVPQGTYALSSPVTATLTADKELVGNATFVFTGANSIENMITIQCAGSSLKLTGLVLDGDEKIAGGLRVENTAAMATVNPNVFIDKCTFVDFRMNTASIWNNGAYIAGSFDLVKLTDNKIVNITRLAGTGNPAVNGTTGIYVTQYDSARWVRQCIHTGNYYYNILGGDLVGSANNVDFDAFKFYIPDPTNFPNTDATAYEYGPGTLLSFGNTYRNARGRAIKVQALADIHNEKIIRDADYTAFGGSTEINLQYGAGTVRDIQYFYTDYSVLGTPTSPLQTPVVLVGFFQGTWYNEESSSISVSGIKVINRIKTGTGSALQAVLGATTGATPSTKDRPLISLSDVSITRGDLQWIATMNFTSGADVVFKMDGITVPRIVYSAIGTNTTNPGVRVIATGLTNLDGVTTPANAKKFFSDTTVPGNDIGYTGRISGHANNGFLNTYNRGADFQGAPLLEGAALAGNSGFGGAASVQTAFLADDASFTFDRRFFNASRGLIIVSVNYDNTTQGIFALGSNQVIQIAAAPGDLFTPSTTGLNPNVDGQLNLWFTANALNVQNRLGASYAVTVMFVG